MSTPSPTSRVSWSYTRLFVAALLSILAIPAACSSDPDASGAAPAAAGGAGASSGQGGATGGQAGASAAAGASLAGQAGTSLAGQAGASTAGQAGASLAGQAGASTAGQAGASIAGQAGAGASGGQAGGASAGGQAGSGGAGAPGGTGGCQPGAPAPPGSYCLGVVSGSLFGLDGAPVGPMDIAVCGGVCIAGKVSSQGTFSVPVKRLLPKPGVSVPLGVTPFAAYEIALTQEGDVQLPPMLVVKLPEEGAPFPAAGSGAAVSSGGVTLNIEPGTEVVIDELLFETDEQKRFRAVAVPPEKAPPFVPAGVVFDALYALGPSATTLTPPARVTFATPSPWPPGASVEIHAHGLDEGSATPTWGSMSKVATGHVSEKGDAVSIDPGEGLPLLTWVGLRLTP